MMPAGSMPSETAEDSEDSGRSNVERSVLACDSCGTSGAAFLLEKNGYRYFRCEKCRLVHAADRLGDPAELYDGLFEEAWLEREIARTLTPRKQGIYRRQIRSRLRKLGREAADTLVLDVGCGVGGFLVAARALGCPTLGVEVSDVAARHARDALDLDVRTAGVEACEDLGERAHLLRANALLEHLPRPSESLRAARTALAPGGIFFGLTLNIDSWTFSEAGAAWRYLGMGGHVSFFDPENLAALLVEGGFEDVRVHTTGFRDESRRLGKWREAWKGRRAAKVGKGHRLYFEARG